MKTTNTPPKIEDIRPASIADLLKLAGIKIASKKTTKAKTKK